MLAPVGGTGPSSPPPVWAARREGKEGGMSILAASAVDDVDGQPVVPLTGGGAMPLIGLGTWQMEGDDARRAVSRALEVGYRHVDTATMYGNEDQVGRALADSALSREQVFVTSKLPPQQAGRAREVLAQSLEALDLDHLDLWLVHWPPGGASPQTWTQLLEAQAEGLAAAVGVSNYSLKQIDELIAATGTAPAVNQVRFGPALWDPDLVTGHAERGVVLEGYSPFKTTDLSAPALVAIAQEHGKTPAQVVLRWHVQHAVVAIPKSTDPERIAANLDVFDFALTAEQVAALDGLG